MKIFTVGHSTLEFDCFVNTLKAFDIEKLIDVRSHPGSRYVPQFNKELLEQSLEGIGVKYAHLLLLGGRRKSSKQADFDRVAGWKNVSFQNYASYTMTDEYEHGIACLIDEAKDKTVCIMCAESVPWRCHRLLISNTLVTRGVDVFHIINQNQCIKHELNLYGAFAEISQGKVIYPKQ